MIIIRDEMRQLINYNYLYRMTNRKINFRNRTIEE